MSLQYQNITYKNKIISYVDTGQKTENTILFLHANGFAISCYEYFIKEYSKNHRVVAVDLWGHGNSSIYSTDFKNWNIFREQVLFICEFLNIQNIIGIGHSLGGVVLIKLSYKKPNLFKKLILVAPAVIGIKNILFTKIFPNKHPMIKSVKKRKTRFKNQEELKKYYLKFPSYKNWDSKIFSDFIKGQFHQKDGFYHPNSILENEVQIFKTGSLANLLEGYFNKIPIHIITIKKDLATPSLWATLFSQKTKGSLIIRNEINHLFMFENPKETQEDINTLLNKIDV